MTDEVFSIFSKIKIFEGSNEQNCSVERLGGLTNRNFKIDCEHGSYVLRLAGEGTEDYINRSVELHNATVAMEAGVNAEIMHFDTDTGTMVSRYIENAVTMDIAGLRDLEVLERTGQAFKKLHDCGRQFEGQFELFSQIDQYLGVVHELDAALPDGYEQVQKEAENVRSALSLYELPNKPCHCDPMVENCIDNGEKVFIIDFEYAGNNDPMWDLGDLSVEGDFTPEQDQMLMAAYFGHSPSAYDRGRMVMYKAMCDLLWTLWGVVQHANKNPADDFWAYAVGRLKRCQKLMATEDFAIHLAAFRRGP